MTEGGWRRPSRWDLGRHSRPYDCHLSFVICHLSSVLFQGQSAERILAMIIIPGRPGKDLCDPHLGMTRRDILRVGGSGLLGLSLGTLFQLQAASAVEATGARGRGPGWGKAR